MYLLGKDTHPGQDTIHRAVLLGRPQDAIHLSATHDVQTKQMDTSQVPSIPPDDKNAQQDPHWPWSVLNIARRQECPAGFALALVNGRVVVHVVGEG